MTEHPNLRCIARLFPLFHIPYPNVIRKCPTEMSPNLLVCVCVKTSTGAGFLLYALLFQHTRNCPFTSLSTFRIPVHSSTVSLYTQLLCPHYGTSCSVPFVAAHTTHPALEGGSLVGHGGAALRIFVGLSVTQNQQLQQDRSTWSAERSQRRVLLSTENLCWKRFGIWGQQGECLRWGEGHCFETTVHHLRWTAWHAQEWHPVRVAAVPW